MVCRYSASYTTEEKRKKVFLKTRISKLDARTIRIESYLAETSVHATNLYETEKDFISKIINFNTSLIKVQGHFRSVVPNLFGLSPKFQSWD